MCVGLVCVWRGGAREEPAGSIDTRIAFASLPGGLPQWRSHALQAFPSDIAPTTLELMSDCVKYATTTLVLCCVKIDTVIAGLGCASEVASSRVGSMMRCKRCKPETDSHWFLDWDEDCELYRCLTCREPISFESMTTQKAPRDPSVTTQLDVEAVAAPVPKAKAPKPRPVKKPKAS